MVPAIATVMRAWGTIRWQYVAALLTGCSVFSLLLSQSRITSAKFPSYSWVPGLQDEINHPAQSTLGRLTLDEKECNAAFPGLTKAIDDLVELGPFDLKQARNMGPSRQGSRMAR